MRRFAFLAVALAIALGACTRVETGTTAQSAASGEPGTAGRHSWTRPGVLRIAGIGEPDTLSPAIGQFQTDVDVSMFWAGYLFNYSDANEFVPELATVVPTLANGGIAKDGRTITYHLRRGVQWQDGAPFDADDVVFSWHLIMNPKNNVQTRTGYELIRAIDEPDKYTAVVHLTKPFSPFVTAFFTMGSTPYPIYPKHLLAQYPDINRVSYNQKPIGTGPFIVKEWHRGQAIRMVANPHYWRGAPKLAEVDYTPIPDENTLTTSMQSHAIDLWYNASPTTFPTASKIAATHAVLTPFTQYAQLGLNGSSPVLSDVQVRRALAYATDRKRLIETTTYGVNLPGEGDQPTFSWAHDAQLKSIPFDLEKARATLEEAGWKVGAGGVRTKNGQRLHIIIVTLTGQALGNRMAVLLQSAWHDAGFDVEVKSYASALMFANYAAGGILQTGKFDVEFSSWVGGTDPDDATLLMCDQFPPHGQNFFHYCNHDVDAQEQLALATYDPAQRKAAYDRIQEKIVDELPWLTMWFTRRFDVVSDDVKGYKPAHAVSTFWNSWEYEI